MESQLAKWSREKYRENSFQQILIIHYDRFNWFRSPRFTTKRRRAVEPFYSSPFFVFNLLVSPAVMCNFYYVNSINSPTRTRGGTEQARRESANISRRCLSWLFTAEYKTCYMASGREQRFRIVTDWLLPTKYHAQRCVPRLEYTNPLSGVYNENLKTWAWSLKKLTNHSRMWGE